MLTSLNIDNYRPTGNGLLHAVMTVPFRLIPMRSPVALVYTGSSLFILVSAQLFRQLGIPHALWLSSAMAVDRAQMWRLVSYSLCPSNAVNYIAGTISLLWFSREIEPLLDTKRTVLLYLVAAVSSGVVYLFVAPDREAPLIGGFAIIAAIGSVFLVWTIQNARAQLFRYSWFWLISLVWVVLLISYGKFFISINCPAWGAGLLAGWRWLRRSETRATAISL